MIKRDSKINNGKSCHITSTHSPFDVRIYHKECKTLERSNYEIVIIAPGKSQQVSDSMRIIGIPESKNRLHRLVKNMEILLTSIKIDANIYHIHDIDLIFVGFLLKIITCKKIIYDVHEDYPEVIYSREWVSQNLKIPFSFIINIIEKGISLFFDYIIVTTPEIGYKFKLNKKVIIIKNYPSVDLCNLRSTPKNQNNWTLVYIGGIERIRGIKEIIQSLKILNTNNKVKLKLIGSFTERDFEEEVRNMPEWTMVEYLGKLNLELVYEELLNCDIGLVCLYNIPRFRTSIPVKLFEYLAFGLPVIAANFPSWKVIIEDNICGICIDIIEPNIIADAVCKVIQNPVTFRTMRKNAISNIRKKYNWENEQEKLIRIYSKLMSSLNY